MPLSDRGNASMRGASPGAWVISPRVMHAADWLVPLAACMDRTWSAEEDCVPAVPLCPCAPWLPARPCGPCGWVAAAVAVMGMLVQPQGRLVHGADWHKAGAESWTPLRFALSFVSVKDSAVFRRNGYNSRRRMQTLAGGYRTVQHRDTLRSVDEARRT